MSCREDHPRACRFMHKKGIAVEYSYSVALDRLLVDDIIFYPYDSHRESHPLEDIIWFSGQIMCGMSCFRTHLPERVRRQFGYVQTIPRNPAIAAQYTLSIHKKADNHLYMAMKLIVAYATPAIQYQSLSDVCILLSFMF